MFLAVLLFNVREQLPFLVGLTNTERQTLPKMSPVNRAFTEDAISVISNNTDMFPAYLDGNELSKDLQLYDQLDELLVMATQVCELIRDTQLLAGSEAYTTALASYRLVGAAAGGGLPGAKSVYEKLRKRFEGQGNFGGTDPNIVPPVAPVA